MKHQLRDRFIAEIQAGKMANDPKITTIAGLIAGNSVQVVAHSLYTVKAPGVSNNFVFTDASDVKETGVNNFANSRLVHNMLMLVDEIRVLGVELAAVPTKDTIKGANYGSIKGLTALQNGVIDIYSDGRIVLKDFPLSNFITDNNQQQEMGTIKLASPKFLFPDAEFKAEIRTGTQTNVNLVIKLELIGIATLN